MSWERKKGCVGSLARLEVRSQARLKLESLELRLQASTFPRRHHRTLPIKNPQPPAKLRNELPKNQSQRRLGVILIDLINEIIIMIIYLTLKPNEFSWFFARLKFARISSSFVPFLIRGRTDFDNFFLLY
jgi:hypothetical protein